MVVAVAVALVTLSTQEAEVGGSLVYTDHVSKKPTSLPHTMLFVLLNRAKPC